MEFAGFRGDLASGDCRLKAAAKIRGVLARNLFAKRLQSRQELRVPQQPRYFDRPVAMKLAFQFKQDLGCNACVATACQPNERLASYFYRWGLNDAAHFSRFVQSLFRNVADTISVFAA